METHLKLKDICHLYLGCPIDRIDFNTKSNNKRKSDTLTVAALRTIILSSVITTHFNLSRKMKDFTNS